MADAERPAAAAAPLPKTEHGDRMTMSHDTVPAVRPEDGYGTDAREPAGWPMTIEEEARARQRRAAAEQLATVPARGQA